MNKIISEKRKQTGFPVHPFKPLYDIDLSDGHNNMDAPSSSSSSSESSSSCGSNSKRNIKTGTSAVKTSVEPQSQHYKAPRVSIIIDQQPEYLDYGKSISGRLYVDTKGASSIIHVKNLRVSLFGHARVHSDIPNQPLSKGLFEYKQDTKILSTGVRIVKGGSNNSKNNDNYNEPFGLSPFLSNDKQQQEKQQQQKVSKRKQSKDKGRMFDPDTFHIYDDAHHSEEHRAHSEEFNNNSIIDSDCWLQHDNNSNNNPNSNNNISLFKQARDKAIEQLMDQIALHAPGDQSVSSHGMSLQVLNAPQYEEEDKDKNYNLEPGKNHCIRFSIPITTKRLLPGSFEDKNYPIRYHILALLIYTSDSDLDDTCFVSHTAIPLKFQPTPITSFRDENLISMPQRTNSVSLWITNSKLDQLVLSVKSKQAVKTMPPPPSLSNSRREIFNTFNQYEKNNSINTNDKLTIHNNSTTWMSRLLHHLSVYYVQRRGVLTTPYLKCFVELPHKTFCQSDSIPVRVHVENTGLDISQVIIETKLKQRLYMTYHCGEMVESKLINQATTLFTANDPTQLVSLPTTTESNHNLDNINDNNHEILSIGNTAKDSAMELKWDGGNNDQNSTTTSNSVVQNNSLCSSRNIVFDLAKVLYVSDQCTHTVLPQMTKDTFEISYELQVTVSVIGSRVISTIHQDGYQSFFYASADQHFSRSNITRNKGYLLKPPSIPIIIGTKQNHV
ncbi:hypothetical protein INT45_001088 [Circinella minor]|uniref:Arrestin C-terminal-like domain-containing protein n=1 Tax=Circinella minor TaxID=1195481 RepID=A0A8H7SEC7_9FUNG|nr:hypothetical protein INT45_001088 [Circinella minor]